MKLRVLIAILGILVGLFAVGIYTFWGYATCAHVPAYFACYQSRVDAVYEKQGTPSALLYIYAVVMPRNGYGTVHLLLHEVGERAYDEHNDFTKSISLSEPYLQLLQTDDEFLRGFDGYAHGVMTGYIMDRQKSMDFSAMATFICDTNKDTPGVPPDEFACFHGVGHALMHANGNKLDNTLALCDTATSTVAVSGCEYGAFMEDSYLFWPQYHPGSPRPDAQGSMEALCARYQDTKRAVCDSFVGQTYLFLNPSDFKTAMHACETLKENQAACVSRVANIGIATHSHTLDEAIHTCKVSTDPKYLDACLTTVHTRIVQYHQDAGDDVHVTIAQKIRAVLPLLGF